MKTTKQKIANGIGLKILQYVYLYGQNQGTLKHHLVMETAQYKF